MDLQRETGTQVKICGITQVADAERSADLGAWAIGMIHHGKSPRYIEPGSAGAAEIGAAMKRRRVEVAGVFVNATLDEIARTVEDEFLTIVQLHGDEGNDFCQAVARRTGAKVMKAIRVSDSGDVRAAEVYRTDFHLFDAFTPGLRGGSGRTFDWGLLGDRRSSIPMVLSGGLNPENVAEAIVAAHPFAVDVASGTEAEPGIKDPDLLDAFFDAVQDTQPEVQVGTRIGAQPEEEKIRD
jgi:phosphoribosylanthranilate isomerase